MTGQVFSSAPGQRQGALTLPLTLLSLALLAQTLLVGLEQVVRRRLLDQLLSDSAPVDALIVQIQAGTIRFAGYGCLALLFVVLSLGLLAKRSRATTLWGPSLAAAVFYALGLGTQAAEYVQLVAWNAQPSPVASWQIARELSWIASRFFLTTGLGLTLATVHRGVRALGRPIPLALTVLLGAAVLGDFAFHLVPMLAGPVKMASESPWTWLSIGLSVDALTLGLTLLSVRRLTLLQRAGAKAETQAAVHAGELLGLAAMLLTLAVGVLPLYDGLRRIGFWDSAESGQAPSELAALVGLPVAALVLPLLGVGVGVMLSWARENGAQARWVFATGCVLALPYALITANDAAFHRSHAVDLWAVCEAQASADDVAGEQEKSDATSNAAKTEEQGPQCTGVLERRKDHQLQWPKGEPLDGLIQIWMRFPQDRMRVVFGTGGVLLALGASALLLRRAQQISQEKAL